MAFTKSGSRYAELFQKKTVSGQTPTEEYLQNMSEFLKQYKEAPEAVELGGHLANGGDISLSTVKKSVLRDMVMELQRQKVPYFVAAIGDQIGIVTKSEDAQKYQMARASVLSGRERYIGIVPGNQFWPCKEGKEPIMICGLNRKESAMFREKLKNIMPGLEVGMDQMQSDKTFTFTFPHFSNKDCRQVAAVYAESMIAAAVHPSMAGNLANRDAYLAVERANFVPKNVKLNETPMYIVGSDKQYLKINYRECEYGTVNFMAAGSMTKSGIVSSDTCSYQAKQSIRSTDPYYVNKVKSLAMKIPDKTVTYDKKELEGHIKAVCDRTAKTQDPIVFRVTPEEMVAASGIGPTLSVVDDLCHDVMKKYEGKDSSMPAPEFMKNYMKVYGEIVEGVVRHDAPKYVREEDMHRVRLAGSRHCFDLSPCIEVADRFQHNMEMYYMKAPMEYEKTNVLEANIHFEEKDTFELELRKDYDEEEMEVERE